MFIKQGKTNIKYLLIVIVLATIVGGGVLAYQYWWLPKEEAKTPIIETLKTGQSEVKIKEISIQKPNLVITGENLSKVQIYMVPTGTGINPETMSLVENATKQSENNGEQIWIYQYPKDLLITNIFAKAFDNKGNLVGRIDLPIVGATALRDALYGSTDETADWQTYRNEEYAFEMKYPENYVINDKLEIRPKEVKFDSLLGRVDINIYNNPNSLSLNQWLSGRSSSDYGPMYDDEYKKEISINGIEGIQWYSGCCGGCQKLIYIPGDKIIYNISLLGGSPGGSRLCKDDVCKDCDFCCFDVSGQKEMIFDQMLSTFRFLE